MLYSGFDILPHSVFWSAYLNGRSDNLDVIRLQPMKGINLEDTNVGPSPVFFLVIASTYYFLKYAIFSAASGASMAVVEGFAERPQWHEELNFISPVIFYLIAVLLYAAFRRTHEDALRFATKNSFHFHLAFFGACILLWVAAGAPPTGSFDSFLGRLIFAAGKWLPFMLFSIFFLTLYRYESPEEKTESAR